MVINFKKNNKVRRDKMSAFTMIFFIILILYTIIMTYMLLWGTTTAFKTASELRNNKLGLPDEWTLQFYKCNRAYIS